MPFFDDSGPRPEEEHGILWRSFSLVKDQLERLILVNILWAAQCIPLLIAWVFDVPTPLFWILTMYTALALVPATAVLFHVVAKASEGLPIEGETIRAGIREQWKPSLLKLLPLYSLFYWIGLGTYFFSQQGWLIPDTLARLLILILAVISLYFGALLIYKPEFSGWNILLESIRLFGKAPAPTLMTGLASLLGILLGVVSIAGFFLIVPVLVALFQVQLYRFVVKG